jgi:uncharacterized damage-inducible protein DinB
LAAIGSTAAVLRALARGLPDELLEHADDGRWSVRDIVAHLLDRRRYQRGRIELMLAEEHAGFPDVDEAESLEASGFRTRTVASLLDELERERTGDLARFTALDEGELGRTGEHSAVGTVTVANMLSHIAYHDLLHVSQAAETVAAIAHLGRGNMRLVDE